MHADDDWALVARAQTGEAEAFGELYDLHLTDIYRFILSMTRDVAVAEELTSRTFFTALRGIGRLRRGTDRPEAWLIQLAGHAVRDHAKAQTNRRSPTGDAFEVPDQDADADPDSEADAEDQAERTRRTIMVRGLLARLPPDQRRCVVLRHVADSAWKRCPGA